MTRSPSSHGVVVCSCGRVITQCRCMEHSNRVVVPEGCEVCKTAKRLGLTAPEPRPMTPSAVTCPYCGSTPAVEYLDTATGRPEQVSPYVCYNCGAEEINPFDAVALDAITAEEKRLGWFAPKKEPSMFKHANTYFPNDKVIEAKAATSKTAAAPRRGVVLDAKPEDGRIKVSWDSGDVEWVDPDRLTKESA